MLLKLKDFYLDLQSTYVNSYLHFNLKHPNQSMPFKNEEGEEKKK